MIERIKVRQLALTPAIALNERLSDVKSFDIVLVELQLSSGVIGYGDALIVDGTTPETLEQAWMIVCTLADATTGASISDATALYLQSHRAAPLSAYPRARHGSLLQLPQPARLSHEVPRGGTADIERSRRR